MIEGIRPTCSGPVEGCLHRCDDHDEDGVCSTCGHRPEVVARFECEVCTEWATSTLGGVAKYHPAAVGFHYDHGLPLQKYFDDVAHINDRLERTATDCEVRETDPLRIRITMTIDGDQLWLDLEADLTVATVGP